jgi:hypothetical protein
MTLSGNTTPTGTIKGRLIRKYWEYHRTFIVVLLIITVGSPFLGLLFAGWAGVFIGFIFSIFSLGVGFFAATKVREEKDLGELNDDV